MVLSKNDIETNDHQKIRSTISKAIKEVTGKGPVDTKVTLMDEVILARLFGCLPTADIKMAENLGDFVEVKHYHNKRFHAIKDNLTETIEKVINRSVKDFFFDINPAQNEGIMVFLLE